VFIGHVVGIVDQLGEIVFTDLFIADIDPAVKTREIDIDPVRIFGLGFKECGILYDFGVYRILECIRVSRLIKYLIFMFGEIDPEISFSFRCIGTVTGYGRYN
jgi:hypothetical protein